MAAVGLVAIALVLSGGSSPAQAKMEAIAHTLQEVDPLQATDTEWIHIESEQLSIVVAAIEGQPVAYQLSTSRQEWWGNEGTLHFVTTDTNPTFFSDEDEAAYFETGRDQEDRLGVSTSHTVVDARSELPDDSADLDRLIRDQIRPGRPENAQYLEIALTMLAQSFDSPSIRSKLLLLIGDVEGLKVGGDGPQDLDLFHLTYRDDDRGRSRLTFGVDGAGFLRYQEDYLIDGFEVIGVPPGTVNFSAFWTAPILTGPPTDEG